MKQTVAAFLLACLIAAAPARAQILQGKWVDDTQAAIEQHRKTDVTVIVLDQNDKAVRGAKVELIQQRHDFVLGLTIPAKHAPPQNSDEIAFLLSFNAIALDRYTDWSLVSDGESQDDSKRLAAWQALLQPIRTHYGRVTSTDPARNPDRLALLGPADLRDAVLDRIDEATAHPAGPDDYDLFADLLQQNIVERKLGQGMLYRMLQGAEAGQPKANFGLRERDVLTHQRGRGLLEVLQKLQVRQVPLDHITIEQSFRGPLQPNALKRGFDKSIAPLPAPVTMVIDVGGSTHIAAAINLETVLRIAFAEPNVAGIYFAGLSDGDFLEEHAGLVDRNGKPTASGEVLGNLFLKYWRSEASTQTDERGNAQARVFTGWYEITATLPDGTTITSPAYLPQSDRAKLIILQATAAEAK